MNTHLKRCLTIAIFTTTTPTVFGTSIENPSFETGDLTGWQSTAITNVVQTYSGASSPYEPDHVPLTYSAQWGDYFATIEQGCSGETSLSQSFFANEGETLLGWSFYKSDNEPYDDITGEELPPAYAKVSITHANQSNIAETILFLRFFNELDIGPIPYAESGWVPWEFVAPESGEYTIEVVPSGKMFTSCTTITTVGIDIAETGHGVVTGGGWINSPAGAYTPDDTLAGKATFGFVSQYKKGASKPTGNTQFKFHLAGMDFRANSYDWLVVNKGATNAQYKGAGTINGDGNFGFMLWGADYANTPDTFRIKIWDKDNNDEVVYDNGFDGGFAQPISGGNIVVKTK